MFYNLHQHREATCRRQKDAWEETINERLSKCEEDIDSIPIVIWGLEASPSFFDFSEEAMEPIKNRIRAFDLLHENYLYNTADKNGYNYGVTLIKNWLNKEFEPTLNEENKPTYSYNSLIKELSNAHFKFYLVEPHEPLIKKNANHLVKNAIHLVYDIFPEWHGLPVTPKMRDACYNGAYMCEKNPDFKKHLEHIDNIFQNLLKKPGEIYFVWLGTKQANKQYKGKKACATFLCCLKKEFKDIKFCYNPEGFIKGKSGIWAWNDDCPADFSAIGVPTD